MQWYRPLLHCNSVTSTYLHSLHTLGNWQSATCLLCIVNGDDSAVFRFLSWWPWLLTLTFELGWDFCSLYLTTKFDHPAFSCSEVIVRTNVLTNKQTDTLRNKQMQLETSTSLRYTLPVGNSDYACERYTCHSSCMPIARWIRMHIVYVYKLMKWFCVN